MRIIKPKSKFSQVFLKNKNIVNKIFFFSNSKYYLNLIEIGAGHGIITKLIINKNKNKKLKFILIEIDEKMIFINERIRSRTHFFFTIIKSDILNISEEILVDSKINIISNLPYNISTLIIMKFIKKIFLYKKILLMLQEEVSRKVTAKINSIFYTGLSIIVQFFNFCKRIIYIPSNDFFPVVNINSNFIALVSKNMNISNKKLSFLEDTCKFLFNKKRKNLFFMIIKLLKIRSKIIKNILAKNRIIFLKENLFYISYVRLLQKLKI